MKTMTLIIFSLLSSHSFAETQMEPFPAQGQASRTLQYYSECGSRGYQAIKEKAKIAAYQEAQKICNGPAQASSPFSFDSVCKYFPPLWHIEYSVETVTASADFICGG